MDSINLLLDLSECVSFGYLNAPMEEEAAETAGRICGD
jgi:hypothetical protein